MLTKFTENIRIAYVALRGSVIRSLLTMLGITIGVASVILLMSVGQAFEKFVVNEFSSFGSNLVVVFGRANNEVADTMTASELEMFAPLTQDDLDVLSNPFNTPSATVVAADLAVEDPFVYNGETYEDRYIVGITSNFLDAYNFEIAVGSTITQDDVDSSARVAVIGSKTHEEVFNGSNVIGETIRIGEVNFRIIGIAQEIDSVVNPQINDIVVLPITTVQQRIVGERTADGSYPITEIILEAENENAVDTLVQEVRTTLRDAHDLEADEIDDFVVFSQNQFLDTLDTITGLLTTFLAVIAGISLIVGGIGIMNIMLVTVTERTKEIGLRKALGAQRGDILTQFLMEAVTLSLIGGAVGTLLAITGSVLATVAIPNLNVSVSLASIALATLISISVGTFFGAYPASRASRLNPIDALRHE